MELYESIIYLANHKSLHISKLAPDLDRALTIGLGCMDFVAIQRRKSAGEFPPPLPGETFGKLTTQEERLAHGEALLALGKQLLAEGDELLRRLKSSP